MLCMKHNAHAISPHVQSRLFLSCFNLATIFVWPIFFATIEIAYFFWQVFEFVILDCILCQLKIASHLVLHLLLACFHSAICCKKLSSACNRDLVTIDRIKLCKALICYQFQWSKRWSAIIFNRSKYIFLQRIKLTFLWNGRNHMKKA